MSPENEQPTTIPVNDDPGDTPGFNNTESKLYYLGLPSCPRLVARSSFPAVAWKQRVNCDGEIMLKELRVVGNHPLNNGVWEDNLAPSFFTLLKSEEVMWTSIDVVRIGYAGESSAPVILWIGVTAYSLIPAEGLTIAHKCKQLFDQKGITDVEVEIRESVVNLSIGPKFLTSLDTSHPNVELCRPLTTTLGFSISSEDTGWAEGTGSFFMAEGGNSKKIFLITTRHIIFPTMLENDEYVHENTSQPRHNVCLLSGRSFRKLGKSIENAVEATESMIPFQERCVELFKGKENQNEFKHAQAELNKTKRVLEQHKKFFHELYMHWGFSEGLVIGHVIFSPPISFGVGVNGFMEDFAVIEMDTSKLDANNFSGNVIDLETLISPENFVDMVHPHSTNRRTFTYPFDRLLRLKGIISVQEMRQLDTLDGNGEPCLIVLKRGLATGLTIGHANNIASFTRRYINSDKHGISKEWPILPRNNKSGPFSSNGDSGALIVDGHGRMVSLLTGGAGHRDALDVTYSMPIVFLLERIAQRFPQAHLKPVFS
ncbi:hypothetical protein Clacol_006644 [Clathrus columnatus]|uniref:Uncharacterized protein n=1 Tax=Clathrus columnatus TaxID=1419009 RepID=A0AAV5AFG8_9AGAM|nr:hypothetical protein Clacol_006644 [Clathrus columnatus]